LYELKGFTGTRAHINTMDVNAPEAPPDILTDEDDTLNNEMQRLADCLENMNR